MALKVGRFQRRLVLLTFLILLPRGASAVTPNGCAQFYDESMGDRGASDVYVSVPESGGGAACFLIPRSTTTHYLRRHYRDGSDVIDMVSFDANDLLSYLNKKTTVSVGSELRIVRPEVLACLADPSPTEIFIHEAPERPRVMAELLAARTRKETSDVAGYLRYIDESDATNQVELFAAVSNPDRYFWCGPLKGVSVCTIIGDYEQMEIAIRYQRADLSKTAPDFAIECARQIGSLFRVQ